MEGTMDVVKNLLPAWKEDTLYLGLIFMTACGILMHWVSRKKLNLPPGPTGLPIVGYLPFLGKEPFKTLDQLKKKYGNVFRLRLGQNKVVILADYTAVEDAFSRANTATRPPHLFDETVPDGFGFGGKNGEEWSEQRRFVMKTMRDLGLGKSAWINLIQEEIHDFLKVIEDANGKPVNIQLHLSRSISNNICSLIFGKRFPLGPIDSLNAASEATMNYFTQAGFWNNFSWLLDILEKLKIGRPHKGRNGMTVFNTFMRKEIEKLKESQDDTPGGDFVSQYLAVMRDNRKSEKEKYFTERNMIGSTQALFLGGSDTIRTTLVWLCITMATFPDVQKKVFKELESSFGKEQIPSWEDRLKLPYTYAVILETYRWKTLVPLNTARFATGNLKICGYDIEKGTNIIANIWGLHNDPKYWKDPENFVPERFLLNDGKEVNLKRESYVPFSYGKRKCPGDTVAMMEIFLYFTSMVRRFEIRAPYGEKPKLDGILGITYQPVPQELCFVPRH